MVIEVWQIWSRSFSTDRWSIWWHHRLNLYFLIKVSFFIYSVRWLWIIVANHRLVRFAWLRSYNLVKVYGHLARSMLLSRLRCHLWRCWGRHWYFICVRWVFCSRGYRRYWSSRLNIRNLQILRIDLTTATFRIYLLKLRDSILIFAYMNFVDFGVIIVILLRIQSTLVPIANVRYATRFSPLVARRAFIRLAIIEQVRWGNLDVLNTARVLFIQVFAGWDIHCLYHLCSWFNIIRKS